MLAVGELWEGGKVTAFRTRQPRRRKVLSAGKQADWSRPRVGPVTSHAGMAPHSPHLVGARYDRWPRPFAALLESAYNAPNLPNDPLLGTGRGLWLCTAHGVNLPG
jgi:hypothetical protein